MLLSWMLLSWMLLSWMLLSWMLLRIWTERNNSHTVWPVVSTVNTAQGRIKPAYWNQKNR
jgi:hypothetical protein